MTGFCYFTQRTSEGKIDCSKAQLRFKQDHHLQGNDEKMRVLKQKALVIYGAVFYNNAVTFLWI